jgi:branched-chain amino acid transport system permease protein
MPLVARRAGTVVVVLGIWAFFAAVMDRGLPLGIVLRGTVFGSLIALLAIGVVLVYRANRIVNFAQAELGSVAAVLAIEAKLVWGWNYFVAIGMGFAMAAVLGALIDITIVRRFHTAPRLILTVATIGLAQILKAMSILIPLLIGGLTAGRFETPFTVRHEIHPEVFNGNHVMVMVVVPAVMLGVMAFLRFTDYGIAIRASAENGDRANLLGIPVKRLSTLVWAMAGFLSATAVILRIPLVGFASFQSVSGSGNALLLRTLAAAVIGRMESLPRTVIAAIGIGIFQEAAAWQFSDTDFVDALLVIVILVGLLLQREHFSRIAESGISTWKSIREVRPVPRELVGVPEVRWATFAVTAIITTIALTLPLWASPSQEQAAALVAIYAIVALSLLVLTGWAGHISLGQFALVGFGGAATGVLYGRHGWDLLLALPVGAAVAAGVALVIGLPALRIRGLFLAVTTLAFAVTAETFFLEDRYVPWLIEESIRRPMLWGRFSLDQGWQQYFFCLVGLLVAIAAVRNLRASRTGRAIIAVRDNEMNAEAATINATRTKLLAFAVSGGLAGFAGGLYVVNQQGLFADAFGADVSIRLFSMVVIGGLGSLPGAVLGAIYVRGAEFFLPAEYELLASGMGILLLLMFLPEGLGGLFYRARDGYLRWVARRRSILVPSLLADARVEEEPTIDVVVEEAELGTDSAPEYEAEAEAEEVRA